MSSSSISSSIFLGVFLLSSFHCGDGDIYVTIVLFCSADRLGGALVVCIASSTPKFSVAQIQSFESVEGSSSFIVRMELFSASIIKFTSLNLKVHYQLYNDLIASSVQKEASKLMIDP